MLKHYNKSLVLDRINREYCQLKGPVDPSERPLSVAVLSGHSDIYKLCIII